MSSQKVSILEYVEAYARTHNITAEQAKEHAVVRNVAEQKGENDLLAQRLDNGGTEQ